MSPGQVPSAKADAKKCDDRSRVHGVSHELIRAGGDDLVPVVDRDACLVERAKCPMAPLPKRESGEQHGDPDEEHDARRGPRANTQEAKQARHTHEQDG